MFIFFGWGKTTKKVVNSINQVCDICNNHSVYDAMIVRKWFTLFFIPVIPYAKEYWLLCRVCNRGYLLKDEIAFQEVLGKMSSFKLEQQTAISQIAANEEKR